MTESTHESPSRNRPAWLGWLLFLAAMAATFVLGMLAVSIFQRRQEARLAQAPPLKPIGEWEMDSAVWGQNFPRQYDSYNRMARSDTKTKYGGSYPRDLLAETPANVVLFSGYSFAKQYQQARGHVHAVEDVKETIRTSPTTPGTCFTCKSPDAPRLMHEMGGAAKFYNASFTELKSQVTHPVGCFDCHQPNTMQLRVTRPALREAFERMGRNIDEVSHQEMRTLVCAQCHVEYYFRAGDNYLFFPWDKGFTPELIEAYYDEKPEFADWTHAISKARMIKMQHPDYEVYLTGVHAARNVACADCHMPYRTEGGVKFTNHHVQSPLLDIANSCAVCHRWSEDEIRQRVESTQDKVREGRTRAENMIALAHFDIAGAAEAGASDEELTHARRLVREAQLRWDYVAAHNGMGFHSPAECLRSLGGAIDLAGQCRVETARLLAKHGVSEPLNYPDFSTKEKAQAVNLAFVEGKPPKLLPAKK